MVKFILSIYNYFTRHTVLLWGSFSLLIIVLACVSLNIRFEEDISGFLSSDGDSERISYAYEHLGVANKLIVSVSMADTASGPDTELMMVATDHFVSRLEQEDTLSYIRKMEYKIDQQQVLSLSRFLVENMPYFLTEEDYRRMDTLLTEENIRSRLNEGKRLLMSPAGMVFKQNLVLDPLSLSAPILSRLGNFQADDRYRTYDDHIFTKDRRKAIVTIESAFPSSETSNNARLIKMIDRVVSDTQAAFDHQVTVKYFGSADIAVTNATQIKKDSVISVILALVLIVALLLYAFKSVRSLVIILVSLAFGWIFAFGILALVKTEVSLIAIGIGSIIVGIAVNYPLHFLDHYRHEQNVKTVFKHIVTPLLIGNITTVGAFLSLVFINSNAMRDLGLFASFLLVGTILFVLLFLPHLLRKNMPASRKTVNGKADVSGEKHYRKPVFGKLAELSPEKNKWFVISIMILSVIFCILSFNTKFETDMQKINYMTDEQKEAFAEMIASANRGEETVYYVSEGATLDEALMSHEHSAGRLEELLQSGELSRINGIGGYLPSKAMQQRRTGLWTEFWNTHPDVLPMIDRFAQELGFRQGTFDSFTDMVRADYPVRDAEYFSPVTETLASNYMVNEPGRYMVMNILHTPEKDIQALESRLEAIDTHSFVFDAGTISRSMVNNLTADFNTVLYFCGFIVFFFLLFTLGRLELSLLAFFPLMVGWFWILGIMNIVDLRFNIVNIILATLIFGQGDDYTIFITEGLMYEYTYGKKLIASYKNSIALSALIMFIGIGSLIISKHPALHSLAQVTIIGMLSVVLMTFVFPPLIFNWLTLKKGKKRLMPVTLVNFFASVYSFLVFLVSSFGITVAGFFLLTLGKRTEKNKMRYHRLLCSSARFVLNHIPNVKSYYENVAGETFDKPGIIICNHQSHIDLMCVMMLSPKIIILTNEWVWNSPFYGQLIRYAYYYPVANGIEKAVDKLKGAIEQGYSIVIFPEGTRSEDCSILRFRRGAFFLAEQLQVDIIPVVIHGVGHLLPKREFMLRKGEIHIRVMDRIKLQDKSFGETYTERARNIRKYYIRQYEDLAARVETPGYFSDRVKHNYIYKGPTVERTVRSELVKHNNYSALINGLSSCQKVLVRNCGYGQFPLLLALVYKNMTVTATDEDEDRLALAAHCTSVPANLHYVKTMPQERYDEFDRIIDMTGDEWQK